MRIQQLAAFAAILIVTGCTGSIGGGGVKATRKEKLELCTEDSGRVTARRLSRREYNNTVNDLFGFDLGQPADAFPEDVEGANGLTVSDLFMEKSFDVAAQISVAAIQRGFVTCDPTKMAPRECARQVLEPFLKRAYRRPVSNEELDHSLAFLDLAAGARGEPQPFVEGVQLAIQDALVSPNFMFRFEQLPDPTSAGSQQLGPYEIANRLSYFVYESMPDAPLFAAAASGRLTKPSEMEAQVVRMIADPKGEALIRKLVGKWLTLDRLGGFNPSRTIYPMFDEALRSSMQRETVLFVKEFLLENRDHRDMLDADFTYANARLAKHYGFPGADALGEEFARIPLAGIPTRGGLLSQSAVLSSATVPSNDPASVVVETSIIFRGKFVMTNLLCADMPAPPANLDINAIQTEAQKSVPPNSPRKVREGVRLTRSPCSTCHSFMDPIGYSLEHFDVLGGWREVDLPGTPVDSTGQLKGENGEIVGSFDGARSLAALLKKDRRLSSCLTETLLRNALGRALDKEDRCKARNLATKVDAAGGGLRNLLISIVQDRPFTHQQGEAP